MPARLGCAESRPALGTPLGLAARTLWGTPRGWGIALVLAAIMFGSYSQTMMDAADSNCRRSSRTSSPGRTSCWAYLAYIALFMGVFVTSRRSREPPADPRGGGSSSRAEYGLSVPMSRTTWLGAHLAVVVVGVIGILAAVGIAMGLGAAMSLEADGATYFADLVLAGLLQAPAVLCVVGIVTALFGWLPRAAAPVGWLLVGFTGLMSTFGGLLDLPDFILDLDPFNHLADFPVDAIAWEPVAWLTAIGAAGIAAGLLGWRRREVGRI